MAIGWTRGCMASGAYSSGNFPHLKWKVRVCGIHCWRHNAKTQSCCLCFYNRKHENVSYHHSSRPSWHQQSTISCCRHSASFTAVVAVICEGTKLDRHQCQQGEFQFRSVKQRGNHSYFAPHNVGAKSIICKWGLFKAVIVVVWTACALLQLNTSTSNFNTENDVEEHIYTQVLTTA